MTDTTLTTELDEANVGTLRGLGDTRRGWERFSLRSYGSGSALGQARDSGLYMVAPAVSGGLGFDTKHPASINRTGSRSGRWHGLEIRALPNCRATAKFSFSSCRVV